VLLGGLPQVPNTLWHPAPQWSVVDPQNPYWEQQEPSEKPMQDKPTAGPQVPSCEAPAGVAVGVMEEVPLVVSVADPVADDEVTIRPEDERYQFALGSPRHSPTVTPR
jgi:hypothetical protein